MLEAKEVVIVAKQLFADGGSRSDVVHAFGGPRSFFATAKALL